MLDRFVRLGIQRTLANPVPSDADTQSAWARRAARAHANAVENLVVFAPLAVLALHAGLGGSTWVVNACVTYKDKRGATRLGFALMLKFFEQEGRFPRSAGELPPAAISYVARQVGADQGELAEYNWAGRTAERHRAQIRDALGFRRFAKEDEPKIAGWLADEVAAVELSDERLRAALLAHCRNERIEPPSRLGRILGAARAAVTERFTASVSSRLSAEPRGALEALAGIGATGPDPVGGAWLAELKADPGRVSRETLSVEINKLTRVRRLGLPVRQAHVRPRKRAISE